MKSQYIGILFVFIKTCYYLCIKIAIYWDYGFETSWQHNQNQTQETGN